LRKNEPQSLPAYGVEDLNGLSSGQAEDGIDSRFNQTIDQSIRKSRHEMGMISQKWRL
jgi:hypothetical protein